MATLTDSHEPTRGLNFSGQTASGEARQHNGNVYNNASYVYTTAKQHSDDNLREDRRNSELLRAAAEGQYMRVQHLLNTGADLDHCDEDGSTALHNAVRSGFEDVVGLLLGRGADVNATGSTQDPPLCLAILKDRSNIVDLLLHKYRAAVNVSSPRVGTPLHCAAFVGNKAVAEKLLELGAAIDSMNPVDLDRTFSLTGLSPRNRFETGITNPNRLREITPLSLAVFRGQLELVRLLADAGSDVNCSASFDKWTCYPLATAARLGDSTMVSLLISKGADLESLFDEIQALGISVGYGHIDCARKLIDSGASLEAVDGSKRAETALHRAARYGHYECVSLLCRRGAKVNSHDSGGCTSLTRAIHYRRYKAMQVLLEYRADLNVGSAEGDCALHQVIREWHGDKGSLTSLLEAGADLQHANALGETPLVFASRYNRPECVSIILSHMARLENGATRNASDLLGLNESLLVAAWQGSMKVIAVLLHAGAEVTARSRSTRKTALHKAAQGGHAQVVSRLLDAGADVETKDKDKKTALHIAAGLGHSDIVLRLVGAGTYVATEDFQRETPLHTAARKGHMQVVIKLVDAGASLSATDHKDRRPDTSAKRAGHDDIYQFLQDKLREKC